jgi:hypothetical protein
MTTAIRSQEACRVSGVTREKSVPSMDSDPIIVSVPIRTRDPYADSEPCARIDPQQKASRATQ